ncbi:MAG: UvrB/UvrC motif-containing protein [Tissierellaceae bacterium]|nr:UvrB/UvrC motif-containing protein [Tissierellaceae bacterium]
MLCDSCGKNEAYIHYTKIINGTYKEEHLCEECALKNYDFDKTFSMNKLFTGLIDGFKDNKEVKDDVKCDFCGLTYSKFRQDGKFGCDKCYETFRDKLDPLIKGLHGNNIHRGKIPVNSSNRILLKREEDSLKTELENAIKMEEFERAAQIRDELKRLKSTLDSYKE